jgi:Uma2 family endonuclease
MATPAGKRGSKTIDDWRALPDGHRFELIDGELVEKAAPSFSHGMAQSDVIEALGPFRRSGGGGPGGWWIGTEIDILLNGRVFRPDLAGWRRERVPNPISERPVEVRPDWICEVVSESNRTTDTVTKLNRYHQAGVPHYWILDQFGQTLTVYRHAADGYIVVLAAAADERVRAEPFNEIELNVGSLLGLDEPAGT